VRGHWLEAWQAMIGGAKKGPAAGDAWSRRHAAWSRFGCCVGVSSCGALAHGL
jgi:hypothetical protein